MKAEWQMTEEPVEQFTVENEDAEMLTVFKYEKQFVHKSGITEGTFVFRTRDKKPVRHEPGTDIFEIHAGDEWIKYTRIS